MILTDIMKKHKIKIITIILYLTTLLYSKEVFITSVKTTGGYLKEMLEILPAVFIISGLITVWIPKEVITKNLGKNSGLKGKLISMLLGSISAGPIYAAFPVAFSLLGKGASISNIVVIISSWAVIKIPMLLVESKFLGLKFMLSRGVLTIVAILLIGYILDKTVDVKDVLTTFNNDSLLLEIQNILPQYNCRACGYKNCEEYAKALANEHEKFNKCKVGGKEVKGKLEEILNKQKGGSKNGNY